MTKMEPGKEIKREVIVNGAACVVTLTSQGVKFTKKGCRNGLDLNFATWGATVAKS